MRVGLIADVHGNAPALEAVLDLLEGLGSERLLVAGDMVGYYPFVNESLSLLRKGEALAVLGNHDAYLLGRLPCDQHRWRACGLGVVDRVIAPEHRDWLASQPATREIEVARRSLFLCHATPRDLERYVSPESADWSEFDGIDTSVVVMGHTHRPFIGYVGPRLFINPGSCGQPRDADARASCALLDTARLTAEIHRVEYDTTVVQRAVLAHGLPVAIAQALSRPRRSTR